MKITMRTALIMSFILIFTYVMLPVPVSAASLTYSNYEKAVDLKILGLLANSPDNFELGRAPTRIEGAVMLVRLLGKEMQAKQSKYTHPFADVPAWADHYVGYMFHNGLTKGTGSSSFGSAELISAKQYVTFVLRSLGYEDKTDFDYNKAIDMAIQVGLLNDAEGSRLKKSASFVRNDMVGISYNALPLKLKASAQTLLDKLVNTDKAVFKPAAKALGLYTSDLAAELGNAGTYKSAVTTYGDVARNSRDLYMLIRKTLYNNDTQLKADIRNYSGNMKEDFTSVFNKASAAVTDITGVENFVSSWEYESNSQTLYLTVAYRYTKNDFTQRAQNAREALNKARYTVARLITPAMSEYEKEKKLHDYIVNNTRYDYENYLKGTLPYSSFEEYGCLVLGAAVCEGYSKAMKLLCDLSGLECMIISGKMKTGSASEGHAWNLVRIDGEYYHLDVTNDDPVSADGTDTLTYYYFNLSDNEMARTNTWTKSDYPACTSLENNYYHKNSLFVGNKSAFNKAVQAALEQRISVIELKVSDYSKSNYADLTDMVFKAGPVRRISFSVNEDLGVIRIYNIQYLEQARL